jgi:hypothetical protein
MKRDLRKRAATDRPGEIKWEVISFAELSSGEGCSEDRFERLGSPDAVQLVIAATLRFREKEGLLVTLAKKPSDIPECHDAWFKYSPRGGGSLRACSGRLASGEELVVVLVWEEGEVIGYGIAATKRRWSEVEIIDVDRFSRREAGLAGEVSIGTETFQIGVGHVVVKALSDNCRHPVRVDATHSSSRYVFKSLGFRHDGRSANPCLLELE